VRASIFSLSLSGRSIRSRVGVRVKRADLKVGPYVEARG